jgi:UDP:flavonoid glycosyltransferase YjiC (YdhE family)
VYVGGISAGPAKALPTDLAKFADSANEGLVVVSFGGSLTTEFPEEMLKRLMDGLGAIKYKVIIRLKTKPTFKIGSNILLTSWLPQNDLLGHKNTVLFITHCGFSSVNEAVYHGVLMLGFPNQDEQKHNAIRFADKNYGTYMDRNTFKADDLKMAVESMMADSKYKDAIKRASRIIQGRRSTSTEEAVYWIDHVIKFGGDHLVPETRKLSWYQIMMLDIAVTVLAIILLSVYILLKCCKCINRLCCSSCKPKRKID